MGNEKARYEAYRDGDPAKANRCWSVFENDDSVDGRMVATSMTEEDAHHIAKLLNEAER